jgi:hypothetical protein
MAHRFLFSMTVLFLLVGCNDQSAALKARGTPSKLFSENLAECSSLSSEDKKISGFLSTIYNQEEFLPKSVQLNIVNLPENFFNEKIYGELTAWKVADNKREYRKMPLNFIYIEKSTGIPIQKAFVDRISANTFDIAMQIGKLDRTKFNNENFLDNFSILMTNAEEEWEGITLTFYNGEEDHKILTSTEALLPPFIANPVEYSKLVNSKELADLHPLKNSQNDTEEIYKRRADAICDIFDQSVNVPRPTFNFYFEILRKLKKMFN